MDRVNDFMPSIKSRPVREFAEVRGNGPIKFHSIFSVLHCPHIASYVFKLTKLSQNQKLSDLFCSFYGFLPIQLRHGGRSMVIDFIQEHTPGKINRVIKTILEEFPNSEIHRENHRIKIKFTDENSTPRNPSSPSPPTFYVHVPHYFVKNDLQALLKPNAAALHSHEELTQIFRNPSSGATSKSYLICRACEFFCPTIHQERLLGLPRFNPRLFVLDDEKEEGEKMTRHLLNSDRREETVHWFLKKFDIGSREFHPMLGIESLFQVDIDDFLKYFSKYFDQIFDDLFEMDRLPVEQATKSSYFMAVMLCMKSRNLVYENNCMYLMRIIKPFSEISNRLPNKADKVVLTFLDRILSVGKMMIKIYSDEAYKIITILYKYSIQNPLGQLHSLVFLQVVRLADLITAPVDLQDVACTLISEILYLVVSRGFSDEFTVPGMIALMNSEKLFAKTVNKKFADILIWLFHVKADKHKVIYQYLKGNQTKRVKLEILWGESLDRLNEIEIDKVIARIKGAANDAS
jgi:hypothetical protein